MGFAGTKSYNLMVPLIVLGYFQKEIGTNQLFVLFLLQNKSF